MAQTEEIMFQNVAYWPTVYRTGCGTKKSAKMPQTMAKMIWSLHSK